MNLLPATVISVMGLLFTLPVSGAALMTEPFDYADTGNIRDQGTNNPPGTTAWTASGTQISRTAGDLVFPGLQIPGTTNSTRIVNNGSGGSAHKQFSPAAVTTGSLYASFLVKPAALPAADGNYHMFFGLHNTNVVAANSGTGFQEVQAGVSVYVKRVDANTYQLGICKQPAVAAANGGIVYGSATFTTNDTVLVVVKYQFNPGTANDDTATLWLNPASLGATEDASPAIAASTFNQPDYADGVGMQYVLIRSSSSGNGGSLWALDNIRVGPTWADVTPAGIIPPPAFHIAGKSLAGTTLFLNGTGGTNNGPFIVLTSTNIASPLASWTSWATGNCDGNGNFSVTNSINPSDSAAFFVVRQP